MKIIDNELFLDRKELIYLIRQIGSQSIIGMEIPELKQDEQEIKNTLKAAEKSLVKDNVIEIDKDKGVLIEKNVLQMVGILAKRNLAILVIRAIRGKGQQFFVHNFLNGHILEHTLPKENLHRLAYVKSQEALMQRIKLIFPLNPANQTNRKVFSIEEKTLKLIKNEILGDHLENPELQLQKVGMEEKYRQAFIKAMKTPLFSASVAILALEGDVISQASSFSVFADKDSSWGIWPKQASEEDQKNKKESDLLIFPTGITDILSAYSDWLKVLEE